MRELGRGHCFAERMTPDGKGRTRVRAPERDRGDRVDGGEGGGDGERARFRVSGQADGTAGDGLDRARDRGTTTAASAGTAQGTAAMDGTAERQTTINHHITASHNIK